MTLFNPADGSQFESSAARAFASQRDGCDAGLKDDTVPEESAAADRDKAAVPISNPSQELRFIRMLHQPRRAAGRRHNRAGISHDHDGAIAAGYAMKE